MAAVVVHGRDQDPAYMLEHLVEPLAVPGIAYLLPVAAGRSWYPGRYFDPRAANEPWLSAALEACEATVELAVEAGVPPERIVLVGFSQGACLLADFIVRRPRPYAAAALLTGALIGGVEELTPLGGLPVVWSAANTTIGSPSRTYAQARGRSRPPAHASTCACSTTASI